MRMIDRAINRVGCRFSLSGVLLKPELALTPVHIAASHLTGLRLSAKHAEVRVLTILTSVFIPLVSRKAQTLRESFKNSSSFSASQAMEMVIARISLQAL